MTKFYTMKSLVKNLMLAAMMVVGVGTASAQGTGTGTGTGTKFTPVDSCSFWMGETVKTGKFYLYNVGAKIFATNNTASEKSINKAAVWTVAGNKTYTFKSGNNNIHMEGFAYGVGSSWTANISSSDATAFTLISGTTTEKGSVYKLSNTVGKINPFTRYFNVEGTKYTAAETKGNYNDWILISAAQKDAYKEYDSLYTKAANILTGKDAEIDIDKSDDIEATHAIENQLKDAMAATTNYTTYSAENGGKVQLEAAIKAAKDFADTTTGIECIKPATADDATVSEIYSINGVRNAQLTKGINIVKMSNGTVKKVIVK